MTPQMETALSGRRALIVGLMEIVLPDHTIRLADGSISITWGDKTFTGKDDTYGTIESIDDLSEVVGDTVPNFQLTMNVPTIEATVALCQDSNQNARVNIWEAVVDAETGEVVPDPDLQFVGEIDTADPSYDKSAQKVVLGIESIWARLLEPDEGANLSDSFQQSIFPGDKGLSNMTSTTIEEIWGPGTRAPAPTPAPPVSQGGANRYF